MGGKKLTSLSLPVSTPLTQLLLRQVAGFQARPWALKLRMQITATRSSLTHGGVHVRPPNCIFLFSFFLSAFEDLKAAESENALLPRMHAPRTASSPNTRHLSRTRAGYIRISLSRGHL